jgi:hypothetical protein
MMESTYLRDGHDPASLRWLDGARLGRILLQAEMRTTPMIVVHETTQVPPKTLFVEHDHVVQALASDGADNPFDLGTLPRRARR